MQSFPEPEDPPFGTTLAFPGPRLVESDSCSGVAAGAAVLDPRNSRVPCLGFWEEPSGNVAFSDDALNFLVWHMLHE
jgi:hypothetical protein